MERWSDHEVDCLTDFLFETNYSIREIAIELDRTEQDVTEQVRHLGLSWVRKRRGNMSRGQAALTSIMQRLLPGEDIISEYHVGKRLKLDVYCPSYRLAAEYHGRQHFFYVPHFHGDKYGFREAQRRDELKEQMCREQGIALVIFRYNDILTEDVVFERMLDAIRNAPELEEEEEDYSPYKENPFYEAMKERKREYRREQYRKMKSATDFRRRGRGRHK